MQQVQQTFDRFADDLRRILASNLFEIIIHGSYALGDFRPHHGDLDYLVVTNDDLHAPEIDRLFALHDRYRSNALPLLDQLEGTYYPKAFLETLDPAFVGCYIGTGRKGWRMITTLQNSYFDLKIIGEYGVRLLGADFRLYQPTPADIRQEQRSDLDKFLTGIGQAERWEFGRWISLIHWCARTIIYIRTGRITSKGESCRLCGKDPGLKGFWELFRMAEQLRYPYREEIMDITRTGLCVGLVARVRVLLD
jgi:hypothetical protein